MPTIDLRGIHFRTYSPQFDQDIADGEYSPVGPNNADTTPGGIDLSIIKFRAWQQNDLSSDVASGGDGGGPINDGSNPGIGGTVEVIWPEDEIMNNVSPSAPTIGPTATITVINESISQPGGSLNSSSGNQTIIDIIDGSVEENIDNTFIATISISESITSGGEAYGDGLYGEGVYGD